MARNNLYPPSVTPGIPILGEKPDGWIQTTFGKILKPIQRKVDLADDEYYRLVVARRNRGGIAPRSILKGREIKTKTQFYICENDFLIAKRQIIHGACGIVPKELGGAIVSNEYSALNVKEGLLLDYLKYLCHTIYFQQTCFQSSIGVDVEKMIFRLDEWFRWPVYLPPILEQCKIANILSTWDEAIVCTERLIAALQARKRGLTQRLLTGKVRFLGFENSKEKQNSKIGNLPVDWKVARLKELVELSFSNVDKKTDEQEISVRLCNYLDVFRNFFIVNDMPFMVGSANDREIERFSLIKNDVLITKDSETAEEIAEASVVVEDLENVICGYHLALLRPKQRIIDGMFLMYLLHEKNVHFQFVRLANGITRFGLTIDAIQNVLIPVPSLAEQQKIAAVLNFCDKELNLLETKLQALKQQKKGLMQRLLTGQVRVKM
jgi:type I restriction enzyme S subunit